MKTQSEIEKAHDLYTSVVLEEIPIKFEIDTELLMIAALDALRWVLDHDHNKSFGNNLANLETMITAIGLEHKRIPEDYSI